MRSCILYTVYQIILRIRRSGREAYVRREEMLTGFDAKSEGNKTLGKPQRTWEGDIKINII